MLVQRFTFKIVLKGRPDQTGKLPIQLRIIYKRQAILIPLRLSIHPQYFDKYTGRVKAKAEGSAAYNSEFLSLEVICSGYAQEVAAGTPFSRAELEARLGAVKHGQLTLYSYTEKIVQQLTDTGHIGNSKAYSKLLLILRREMSDIELASVSSEYIHALMSKLKKCGQSGNTIHFYVRTLRAVFNRARKERLIKASPFAEVTLAGLKEKTIKRAITKDSIQKIETYKPKTEGEQIAADIFLFSYYTRGINAADIVRLKWSDIGADNRLEYVRRKTGVRYSVRLHPKALDIIQRYKGADKVYIFGFVQSAMSEAKKYDRGLWLTKKVNARLKDICKDLGLPPLTFYAARHSWASALKHAGVSTSIIQAGFGHTSIRTTEIYLSEIDQSEIDQAELEAL